MVLFLKKTIFFLFFQYVYLFVPYFDIELDIFSQKNVWKVQSFLFLLIVLLFDKELFHSFKSISIKKVVTSSIGAFGVIYLFYQLFSYFYFGSLVSVQTYEMSFFFVLNTVVFAPLLEEMGNRFILIDTSSNKSTNFFFLILTSLLFTLGHLGIRSNGNIFLYPIFFMGIVLGWVCIRQKNIWYSIFAHSFYNGMVLCLSLLMNS